MLLSVLNISLMQHTTKQQFYGNLRPIWQTIQVKGTKYAEQC